RCIQRELHETIEADPSLRARDFRADQLGHPVAVDESVRVQVGEGGAVQERKLGGRGRQFGRILLESRTQKLRAAFSRMDDKVVLITGGARRVGAATCRLLHAAGARLMLHYRTSANEARALQAELNGARPDSVALVQADLLNLSLLPSTVNETVNRFGRLDALVNNASSFHPTPIGEITEESWDDLVGTNLKSPLFLSQAA